MIKITKLLPILALTLLSVSCGGKTETKLSDYSREVYEPQYAGGFEIKGTEGGGSSLIEISNPWQGADSVKAPLLVLRGDEEVPEGYDGQVLRGDAKRVIAMSSTHVAMLDALGLADRIVGVSGKQFITNPRIQSAGDNVADVGYEGNINYELIVAQQPDLVLLYGVNGASSMEGKLRELGIPYMYVGDYLEESPLGKAEWLMALAEVTGKREEGEKIFAGIPVRYNALKKLVAEKAADKPAVMVNTPYNDAWFMPSVKSYAIQLISDAGGAYLYDKNTGNSSEPIDMEEAYLLAEKADVWINVGQAASMKDVAGMCPKFTDTRCFKNGYVYNNNARVTPAGGNDYFESAVVNPDIILRDLIKIFHPELVEEDFVYYRRLK